jgi:hypothetical protein
MVTKQVWIEREIYPVFRMFRNNISGIAIALVCFIITFCIFGALTMAYVKYKEGAPERERAALEEEQAELLKKAEEQLKINRMADSLAIYGVRP